MAITFDRVNKLVIVGLPDVEVTVQQLINAVRDYEDELANLDLTKIAEASGKEDLGGGLAIGITLKLIDWKVKFADRASWTVCEVKEGNLISWDTALQQFVNPIANANYVNAVRSSSVSATIVETATSGLTQPESDQLMSLPLAAAIADATWDEIIENNDYRMRDLVKLISAVLAGKLSGAGTTMIKIRDVADTKDRIVATVDAKGNRTAVQLDVS